MEIQRIAIDKLFPNDWNPNHIKRQHYEKLKRFIEKEGSVLPIVVRPHPSKKGCYQIIDGFHRWQIAKESKQEDLEAVVVEAPDDRAQILTVNLNYLRGQAKPLEYAKLIHDLTELHSIDELEMLLPDSKPQLLDRLELLQLPSDLKRDLEQKSEDQEKEVLTTISFQVTADEKAVIDEALETSDKKKKGAALTQLVRAGAESLTGVKPPDSSLTT